MVSIAIRCKVSPNEQNLLVLMQMMTLNSRPNETIPTRGKTNDLLNEKNI